MNLAEKIYESVKPLPPAAVRGCWTLLSCWPNADTLAAAEARDLMQAQQTSTGGWDNDWDNDDVKAWQRAPAV